MGTRIVSNILRRAVIRHVFRELDAKKLNWLSNWCIYNSFATHSSARNSFYFEQLLVKTDSSETFVRKVSKRTKIISSTSTISHQEVGFLLFFQDNISDKCDNRKTSVDILDKIPSNDIVRSALDFQDRNWLTSNIENFRRILFGLNLIEVELMPYKISHNIRIYNYAFLLNRCWETGPPVLMSVWNSRI